MTVMLVYVTTRDAEDAKRIGRTVVAERLAACANVISDVFSIYWWEGTVQEGGEAALILKTTDLSLEALIARIKTLHSYDCPAIEAWPLAGGYSGYLEWVVRETALREER